MKKFLIILTYLFFIQILVAQKTQITWKNKYNSESSINYPLLVDETGIYFTGYNLDSIRTSGRESQELIRYSLNRNFDLEGIIAMPITNSKQHQFKAIVSLAGERYILSTLTETSQKKIFITSFSKGELTNDTSLLLKVDDSGMVGGEFYYDVSPNNDKLLISYKKGGLRKFSDRVYAVFNSKLRLVWEKTIALPYKSNYSNNVYINNNGILLINTVFRKLKGKKGDSFILFTYDHRTDKLIEKFYSLPDKIMKLTSYLIHPSQSMVDNNNKFTITGLYSDDKKLLTNGSYIISFDEEGNV